MFIPKPIDKIDFNKNVLKINETTTIKFNKCDLDVELIESLISKGAYASTLLYLNSKCLVENINGEILTKDSYSNYLQECKDLLKENVYETTASGFRQLCNINGLEVLENNKFVARGKTKLYVENFKEEYFPDLVMNIISEFNDSEMSRDDYMNALNKISELEWENKISTDDYDRANKKLNKIYIDNRSRSVEPVNESCEEVDCCSDTINCIRKACEDAGNEESVKSLLQSLNNEVKSLADKYNVVLDEINECEGTQTTDIAPKLDQEVGRLVKPPKSKKKLDEKLGEDFWKERIIKDFGYCIESIEEGDHDYWVYLINGYISNVMECHTIHERTLEECYEVLHAGITKVDGDIDGFGDTPIGAKQTNEEYDFNVGFNHRFKGFILTEQGRYERGNFVLVKEGEQIKAIHKSKLNESRTNSYGDILLTHEEAESKLKTLCSILNQKFSEYGFRFKFRVEERNLVIFDANEEFDYESRMLDEVENIVKRVFGNQVYLEPYNSVIFVIANCYVE